MGSDDSKTPAELAALLRFIAAAKYPVNLASIEKLSGERKPDFSCRTFDGELFAFEVTALCAEELARMINQAFAGKEPDAVFTGNPTLGILRKKMRKNYDTDLPVELLCYWDGRTFSTDDEIFPMIEQVVNGDRNPFRRVWYLGEIGRSYLMYDDWLRWIEPENPAR